MIPKDRLLAMYGGPARRKGFVGSKSHHGFVESRPHPGGKLRAVIAGVVVDDLVRAGRWLAWRGNNLRSPARRRWLRGQRPPEWQKRQTDRRAVETAFSFYRNADV